MSEVPLYPKWPVREVHPLLVEHSCRDRDFFIDNLLVRVHFIIEMIRWTGLAPWEFEFTLPGGLTSTFRIYLPKVPETVSERG